MQKTNNLQDLFLLRARKSHASLTVFLMNGYQLRGQITGYDAFVVVLMTGDKQQAFTSTPSPPLCRSGPSLWRRRGRQTKELP